MQPPDPALRQKQAATLAAYLRNHPEAVFGDRLALAAQLGIDPTLVPTEVNRRSPKKPVAPSKPAGPSFSERFDELTSTPLFFLGLTGAIGFMVSLVLQIARDRSGIPANFAYTHAALFILLAVVALHGACYVRYRSVRLALRGTGLFFLVHIVVMIPLALFGRIPEDFPYKTRPELVNIAVFSMMLFSMVYGFIAVILSVVGNFLGMQRERRSIESLDRMELLERMFEIEGRLNAYPRPVERYEHPAAVQISRQPILWAAGTGAVLSLIYMTIPGASLLTSGRTPPPQVMPWMTAISLLVIVTVMAQITIAFCTKGVWMSIIASLVFQAAGAVVNLIPINGWGYPVLERQGANGLLASVVFALVWGVIGGIGGNANEWAKRRQKLKDNDPDALIHELIEIQQRLALGTREAFIVVVDAAKSSQMKATADPYVAEWSFRAYQRFLRQLAEEHRGTVISTAGDGAVLSFVGAKESVDAAWAIQLGLDEFNRGVNRLITPFCLRIGVHTGPVSGHVEMVEYTEVIDIAAHVQGAGEIGGVAVSEPVWRLLGEPQATRGPIIDGFPVYYLAGPA